MIPSDTIIIKDILLSSRLGKFLINQNTPREEMLNCQACLGLLLCCASLVSLSYTLKIRVGICENCGYMGYMDRLTKSWLVDFYSSDWDREFIRTPQQMREDVVLLKGGVKGSRYNAFELHRKLQINKEKPFFEIGSGYGQVMKNFEIAGFSKLYGIENSKHRADLVKKIFGFNIYSGDFGNPVLTTEIKKTGPYGLIFSHHVLEHVYNPSEVLETMSKIQEEGDYAIFALPNVAGEHINYTSLYWPHLHGFTKESLEILFNRYGYEVVIDGSTDIFNLCMAFKKTKNPKKMFTTRTDYFDEAKSRFSKGLQLDHITHNSHKLIWEQTITERDTARIESFRGGVFTWYISQVKAYIKSRIFKRLTPYYVMLVGRAKKRLSTDDSVEIQFKKEIIFLIK